VSGTSNFFPGSLSDGIRFPLGEFGLIQDEDGILILFGAQILTTCGLTKSKTLTTTAGKVCRLLIPAFGLEVWGVGFGVRGASRFLDVE
jgi:hypothetical protein